MIKYTETKLGITKDGHTMFRFDIVQDLNRKSHLEDLTLEQQQEISELKEWQRKAFECYPNIDIDIEGLET